MAATQTRGIWVLMVVPSPFCIVQLEMVTSLQRVFLFEVAVISTGKRVSTNAALGRENRGRNGAWLQSGRSRVRFPFRTNTRGL